MATLISRTLLSPERDARRLVVKWVVALLIPLLIFTFVWNGEAAINQILLGFFARSSTIGSLYDIPTLVGATIFFALFYAALTTFVGYAVAADSGRQKPFLLWISMLVFTAVPIVLISIADDLFVGLSFSVLVWLPYFLIVWLWRRSHPVAPTPPLERLGPLSREEQENLVRRAIVGAFWFGTSFAAVALVIDLIYFFTGSYGALGNVILIWILVRTLLFPIVGYLLGRLGGRIALRHVLKANGKNGDGQAAPDASQERSRASFSPLAGLSNTRAREEARDLVPNDAPLRSTGARAFYLVLLFAFLLLYPMLDPFLFGQGTDGRLASYGDAGRYVILALGLNIVVGFAGLLDLGYVAFFVFGAYTWAMVGSPQLTVLTGLALNPTLVSWLFWPMLLVAALVAALWGVLLGAPTLRLRGDYLAIVTLGFGEIIPIIAQNMDKY